MIRLRLPPHSPLSAMIVVVGISALALGCTTRSESFTGSVPPGLGITCSTTRTAGDTDAARAALAGAPSGTCVVLTGAAYAGPLALPPGVALVAQNGSRARITGGTAQDAAISLAEGSQLAAVDVMDSVGVGIAIRAGTALVNSVTVTGSKSAALAVLCKTPAACAAGSITLTNVVLEKSSLGLWVSGAHVVMKGGSSDNHAGTSLSSAAGVIAQDGAQLDFDGVLVEKNQGVGILIDGAQTKASLKNAIVNENGERGVWAQRVSGTLDAPALRLDGCQVTKNKVVGVGAVESHGIIIVGGRIADTVASPLVTNLESTEQIGDGVGLFASGELKLEGTVVESNARTAGIIDGSDRGIIIVGGKVGAGPLGLKFVVQNTKGADVQVPDADRSAPAKPLGVSAPKLGLPPVL